MFFRIKVKDKNIKKLVKLLDKYNLARYRYTNGNDVVSVADVARNFKEGLSLGIFLKDLVNKRRDVLLFMGSKEQDVVINFKQLKNILQFFYGGTRENLHLAINVEENTKEKLKYLKKMGLKWVDGSSLTKDIPEGLEYIIASLDGINFDRECFYYGSLDKEDIVVTLDQFERIIGMFSTAGNTND